MQGNNVLSSVRRVNGPVGMVIMLLIIVLILVAEPSLGWIMLPALLIGMLIAVILRHSSRSAFLDDKAKESAEIRIDSIPVGGGIIGAIFTLGTMAMFFAALHEVRWFFLSSLPCGILAGLFLHLWHARHPST
jgi:hypothetical protein